LDLWIGCDRNSAAVTLHNLTLPLICRHRNTGAWRNRHRSARRSVRDQGSTTTAAATISGEHIGEIENVNFLAQSRDASDIKFYCAIRQTLDQSPLRRIPDATIDHD